MRNKEVLLVLLLFFPSLSEAMDFRIFFQPELKQNVIVADGYIADGDDKKFLSILNKANKDNKGYITLVLNSLGGSVKAAFELVKVMDQTKVYAVVPQNALCASACASIVFVSAERHMVVGDGRLGFHTCYKIKSGEAEPSAICNELVAQNAVERGTNYAAVDLFNADFGPDRMAWLDKELACIIGLCKP